MNEWAFVLLCSIAFLIGAANWLAEKLQDERDREKEDEDAS